MEEWGGKRARLKVYEVSASVDGVEECTEGLRRQGCTPTPPARSQDQRLRWEWLTTLRGGGADPGRHRW